MSESDKPDYSNIARTLGEALITMSATTPRSNPFMNVKPIYLIYNNESRIYSLPEHGLSFEKNQVLLKTWYPDVLKGHGLPYNYLDKLARVTGFTTDFIRWL